MLISIYRARVKVYNKLEIDTRFVEHINGEYYITGLLVLGTKNYIDVKGDSWKISYIEEDILQSNYGFYIQHKNELGVVSYEVDEPTIEKYKSVEHTEYLN